MSRMFYVLPQLFLTISCQSNVFLSFFFTFLFQIVFNMSRVCSTSTILGTNGLNSADVPLSNKQTNKSRQSSQLSVDLFQLRTAGSSL